VLKLYLFVKFILLSIIGSL